MLTVALLIISAGPSLAQGSESLAANRALEFANLFGSLSEEKSWKDLYLPEYWHPLGNESGLSGRPPSFMPSVATMPGDYLYTSVSIGRVMQGFTPWLLDGKEKIVLVELLFVAVAQVEDRVTIFESPKHLSQFYAMAIDHADGRWKYLDSFPNTEDFYQIPYFLKAWEKIKGKGSIKNIAEVRDRLLALVSQKSP